MKNVKFGKWSGIAAVITGGLILNAVPAFATDVILSGDVAAITTITIAGSPALGSTIGTAGLTDFAAATVTERNNVTAGYKVTVHSANAFSAGTTNMNVATLTCAASPATPITYTMKYGTVAVVLVATTGSCEFTRTTTVNTPDGIAKVLAITTSAATSMHAGTYTDTVTLTIAAL